MTFATAVLESNTAETALQWVEKFTEKEKVERQNVKGRKVIIGSKVRVGIINRRDQNRFQS